MPRRPFALRNQSLDSDDEVQYVSDDKRSKGHQSKENNPSDDFDDDNKKSSEKDYKRLYADADRRLAKVTKAHKDLEMRYDELKHLRETAAERLLRDFQQAAERKQTASDKLISSLEEQLAVYTSDPIPKTSVAATKAHTDPTEEKAKDKLIAELHSKVRTLERDLAAEIENSKSLSSRLTKLNRPGTGTHANSNAPTTILDSASGSNDEVSRDALEVYEDLTGMLIRRITKEKDETVIECLHAGKNGTLHFKLVHSQDEPNLLHYKPLLDPNRDHALIQLLPEYLTDDISFKRDVAQLFFWRVLNFLVEEPQV